MYEKRYGKSMEVMALEEFLHTVLLYQAITVRIIKKNYFLLFNDALSSLKKNNKVTFYSC